MWHLADKPLISRLLLGTAGYPSLEVMADAVRASKTEVITVSLKRQMSRGGGSELFWQTIQSLNCNLLPNTAGCRDAQTAITTAEMARELFHTSWIKLEVIGDDFSLQPDPFELVYAASELVKRGFEVFPYCTEDLVLCQRLVDCGCRILMPWAAPIGSGKGLLNPFALGTLRQRLPDITLIVDAGIGKPSDATRILELGFDAVLLNSAVASAIHPVAMAEAFSHAVAAGRGAFEAGLMAERIAAQSCTPLIDTPFWQQEVI
ncbi:thiazole synthase [Fluoribacter dumoffii]|uniref:thiazole synthase n=1 Tax=Fluoribacter dumoffii TaxID=463 RepID=UPI002244ACB1|nr:thiazole synthase [Fluoribacter dumoffii]MCW8418029.1 thiazole synthase [Fluoribacter dumoffii]MCW8454129.1 thiazole synthase [Fluoribacter dumoffii]MCW8461797.1 thiazole synthase [Fluoribacter dumoffii]MCW8482013.1 thiazole synthase [Fluoribacter dumoffii]